MISRMATCGTLKMKGELYLEFRCILVIWVGLTIFLMVYMEQTFRFKINESASDNFFRESGKNVVFFNIFIPDGVNRENALNIAASQLNSMKASHHKLSKLFYNLIGNITGLSINLCENIADCTCLNHISVGDEIITLQALHDFCLSHSEYSVSYIHNKGSFHPSLENDVLRQLHMRANFETDTCKRAIQNTNCNVCSGRFSPLPHFHTSGNMWTAKCNYIKKLHAPSTFEAKMDLIVSEFRDNTSLRALFLPCIDINENRDCLGGPLIGYQRFASEHWIHSHPSVVPCDTLPSNYTFMWMYNNLPDVNVKWETDLHVGPRFTLESYLNNGVLYKIQWFTLAGRLYEWDQLYNEVPDKNSWVWFYYGSQGWGQ